MTNPFTADDLMRRSLFGSLIGFGKRKNKTAASACNGEQHTRYSDESCFAGCSFRSPADDTYLPEIYQPTAKATTDQKSSDEESAHLIPSEQDIYREIVAECARFEENRRTDPLQQDQTTTEGGHYAQAPVGPGPLDEETTNTMIKLIVGTVMKSLYANRRGMESPEEILRKKRLQNNEAAARYRKRQKELREETEIEVRILENKNRQLRKQVESMQREIDKLKKEVLQQKDV